MCLMKNRIFILTLGLVFAFGGLKTNAQNLLDQLNSEFKDSTVYLLATFNTTRIGLGHSTETRKKGALEITAYSRYWNYQFARSQRFLADEITARFGLDYSFTDNFTVGLGYTTYDKITDGYLKYKILRQTKDNKNPVNITLVQTISHRKFKNYFTSFYLNNTDEDSFSAVTQVLISRKMNKKMSLQLMPTYIRKEDNDVGVPNNQFSLGFGGRFKISNHTSFVSEYYYVANPITMVNTYNAFMVGLNWEVSDLMLQFQLTNARNFAEATFITETTNNFNFKNPNLHFGFNATLVLHTSKNKLKKKL